MTKSTTTLQHVINALHALGGKARLEEIYDRVLLDKGGKVHKQFHHAIKSYIYWHSSDSKSWKGKEDIFESVEGIRKGVWALRNTALWSGTKKPRYLTK